MVVFYERRKVKQCARVQNRRRLIEAGSRWTRTFSQNTRKRDGMYLFRAAASTLTPKFHEFGSISSHLPSNPSPNRAVTVLPACFHKLERVKWFFESTPELLALNKSDSLPHADLFYWPIFFFVKSKFRIFTHSEQRCVIDFAVHRLTAHGRAASRRGLHFSRAAPSTRSIGRRMGLSKHTTQTVTLKMISPGDVWMMDSHDGGKLCLNSFLLSLVTHRIVNITSTVIN